MDGDIIVFQKETENTYDLPTCQHYFRYVFSSLYIPALANLSLSLCICDLIGNYLFKGTCFTVLR